MKNFLFAGIFLFTLVSFSEEFKGRTFTYNVQRTKNQVALKGFRPLTQKGPTCLIYSTVMILRYYHCNVLPREFKIAIKNGRSIDEQTKKYGFETFVAFPRSRRVFAYSVKKAIDNGIPIRWGVDLNLSPIESERQGDGGHARIITGYLHQNGILTGVIYADSWGKSKNMNKRMNINSAYRMTMEVSYIYPEDLKKEVVAKLKSYPSKLN